ncbi:phosphatase PAP2 family protein [Oceanobacillus jeddahense]|uniref:phosphatase PAP2 family protein n=1 Tax=Oceanobacillus jeddahense TaxID=1462527 RepID=UPI000693D207|nr:phosphatase PAP2 family protein [Oceanobacillus jeddahense]
MKSQRLHPVSFLLTGIIFLLLFGVITWGIYFENSWIHSFDLSWIERIQGTISEGKTSFIMFMTELGSMKAVIAMTIIICIVLFFKRKFAEGLWFGGTILFCAAIGGKVLKKIVDRDRPAFLQLIEKTNESFPSGHATATTIFYGFIGMVLILAVYQVWKKIIIGFITLIWIGFILFTRIYLGIHFPTDVLAGFVYGLAAVFISIGIYLLVREPLRQLLQKLHLADHSQAFKRAR